MDETRGDEAKKKVRELVKDARIAMMAIRGEDGFWHSRPMATIDAEFDGTLWFLTDIRSHKVDLLESEPDVHLTYSNERKENYVSVSGRASVVRDRSQIEALWSEAARAWFPAGKNDPNLVALKVEVDVAEYWDSPSGNLVLIYGYLQALATGKRTELKSAEHGRASYPKG